MQSFQPLTHQIQFGIVWYSHHGITPLEQILLVGPVFSEELLQFYDLGYLGIEKDYPNQISILPYKKKKGKKLTIPQKGWNKLQSKIRIKVEHVIAQIKQFRINRDMFRNKLCRYDVVSEIVCGIVNFKIKWKEEFITIL